MELDHARAQLLTRLAEELGAATSERLVAAFPQSAKIHGILVLLNGLWEVSPKVARAAIETLPELHRRERLGDVVSWLEVCLALAESSGASALKYLKESPLLLGLVERAEDRGSVLSTALELADEDANVTLEYLRTAPQLLTIVPSYELTAWLEIGTELTQVDVVVGLEYIRQIHAIAPVLPLNEVRRWVAFGMELIVPNSLGKPDYMPTIEFLRTSPAILADIEQIPVRSNVVALGAVLADHSIEAGIAWLSESPRLLRMLPSPEWQMKMLQYGALLGEQDPEATLAYLRRCPELIGLIGNSAEAVTRFENWFKAGMEILDYSIEGARAYFALESQGALASVEKALSGVPLRQVARTIKLFVQGLCGTEFAIQALPDSLAPDAPVRATISPDGRTISLPSLLRRYATAEDNTRLYLVMAAHEAGHVEFGTYRLRLEPLADLVAEVRQRYGRTGRAEPQTLTDLFRFYQQPRLVQDIWMLLEDARVEFLLQQQYPGLRRDLQTLAREAVETRSLTHGLTIKELIVDQLLQLSSADPDSVPIHEAIKAEVAVLWPMCRSVQATTATAEEVVRVTHDVYVRLEELLVPKSEMIRADQVDALTQDLGVGPSAPEETSESYRPVTNFVYRGTMNPEFIRRYDAEDQTKQDRAQPDEIDQLASAAGGAQERTASGQQARKSTQTSSEGAVLSGGWQLPAHVEELLALDVDQSPSVDRTGFQDRAIRYPEWDQDIHDYRLNWCRVVERAADERPDDVVAATLQTYGSVVSTLRRFFESLRPPGLKRVAGQVDGDDIDLDAAVRVSAERAAGAEESDRIYIRRDRKERDVATAFLVDVSGSTSRQLTGGRRVIDVEREGLVLLCEALEAVGDQYALYGYSGQGRGQVDFLVIKDFADRLGGQAASRLAGLTPLQQNRDGAAIRHATSKLLAREAKTKLLIIVSDGRPLDDGYRDEYSLEDTKTALREAKRQGIHPFCITIDRDADTYLKRMYGDVQFTVIDRVESLPLRLPRIYQRLTT
ncbi:MAG TPA: VWA domain-containing protein [Nitrospiraceae bacterium]|nr:VWA domain-containing protein [Nitrospiraceae bacterium]